MTARDVDLVVIGAGIHGAGIAQAAAAAGHSVLVIERRGIAAGTSGKSSKLIHGGLRYLEQGELGLVRECLRERALLLRLAPELVRLVPFRLPVYAGMRRGPLAIRAGLALYAGLAGLGPEARFRALPPTDWATLDGLATDGLRALFEYRDGQTDDAALTRAVLASAVRLGAQVAMPAEVEAIQLDEAGATVRYTDARGTMTVTAHAAVNAAGPWLNAVLGRVSPAQAPATVDLVRGTHIELPGRGLEAVYYVEAPQDGRAVLVMPRPDCTLVGTTEQPHTDPDHVEPTPAEIDYLLATVRTRFPAWAADGGLDVRKAWAGLRVLPRNGREAFRRSRETAFLADRARRPRLLTLAGGKLTSYRATAEQALERLRSSLPGRAPCADTRRVALPPA